MRSAGKAHWWAAQAVWALCILTSVLCSVAEWLRLLPFLGVLALLGYLAVRPFFPKKKQQKDSLINLKIQKENPKVVNEINIEDLNLTKAAYCRCWRSKTVRYPLIHRINCVGLGRFCPFKPQFWNCVSLGIVPCCLVFKADSPMVKSALFYWVAPAVESSDHWALLPSCC